MSKDKNFKITKVEKLPEWEAQITGEISLPFIQASRKEALESLNKSVSLPGFRSGKIPEDVLAKSVGEMRVLEETAEVALAKEYANIVIESKLKPITRPRISITKLAPGIPLEFKIDLVLEPEFDLPDYKNIAKKSELDEAEKAEDGKDNKDEAKLREKRRLKILENLVKETKLDLPKKLVDAELLHMLAHFKQDVEKAGIKWDEYLEKIKKTEEEIREGWRENVVSRAKTELVLSKIAEKEKLKTYQEVFEFLEK